MEKKQIRVGETEIAVLLAPDQNDYICLTDMVRAKGGDARAADIIKNWIRSRTTIEFLGTWESLYNPDFKVVEFDHFRKEAGLPTFTMSVSNWVERTHAVGIVSKSGRHGGTYAHKDIAFEFGAAISPIFKLYLIKEYQLLKEREDNPLLRQWDVRRVLSKTNYRLHTEAIKENIVPRITAGGREERLVYATEADLLNLALFGCTAKDWEEANPSLAGKMNVRDTASINQLVVLANMESYNSEMIKQGIQRGRRFDTLRRMAEEQLRLLDRSNAEQNFRKIEPDGSSLDRKGE